MPSVRKVIMALAGLSACALTLSPQTPSKTSAEFRKSYLEKFPWTGANTTAGDAMMLRILVEARGARRGLEIGSNSGFGAINMGIAFERNKGRLTSLEISPRMVAAARTHLDAVGLGGVVTVVEGDALKTIPGVEGPFDFVFIDALKPDYLKYFKLIEPKLAAGATIVADNVIAYARDMPDFLDYIQKNPAYDSVIIRASMQKNDGMLVAYKNR
jgi:predicted O-methyltransferase YrrM